MFQNRWQFFKFSFQLKSSAHWFLKNFLKLTYKKEQIYLILDLLSVSSNKNQFFDLRNFLSK
ncbi:hypothetical protein EW14_1323 [Prochlorococcus sp. MIT 0604]|nr:hypothetical protein EW14_1323 [Prochlorococcus sp. MIT 0604]